jgi:CBS domain-containing protein
MLQVRHRRTRRTAADRRLRPTAISSIITIIKRQGHKPSSVLMRVFCRTHRNKSGAKLLIEDSREQRKRSFKGAIGFKETTMTVRAILDSKGHQIQSVEPDAKLSAAVKILAERKIGAVLAISKGRIEGILSERDIVRALGERGAGVLDEPVSDLMTRKVVSCKPADTVAAIMEMMTMGKFRHLPVVDGERVVGLISIGDVVKWRVGEYEMEQEALREYIKTA